MFREHCVEGIRVDAAGDVEVAIALDVLDAQAAPAQPPQRFDDGRDLGRLEARVADPDVKDVAEQHQPLAALARQGLELLDEGSVRASGTSEMGVGDQGDCHGKPGGATRRWIASDARRYFERPGR